MKNFERNGNEYKMKPQLGTYVPLVGIFSIMALVGFVKMPESSFKWWMLGIVVILMISLLRAYFIIDMDRREMRVRKGLFGKEVTVPLESLQGFSIHKLKQYGFITINVALIARYKDENGKEKKVQLAQSYFTKPISRIINEIDEIIAVHLAQQGYKSLYNHQTAVHTQLRFKIDVITSSLKFRAIGILYSPTCN